MFERKLLVILKRPSLIKKNFPQFLQNFGFIMGVGTSQPTEPLSSPKPDPLSPQNQQPSTPSSPRQEKETPNSPFIQNTKSASAPLNSQQNPSSPPLDRQQTYVPNHRPDPQQLQQGAEAFRQSLSRLRQDNLISKLTRFATFNEKSMPPMESISFEPEKKALPKDLSTMSEESTESKYSSTKNLAHLGNIENRDFWVKDECATGCFRCSQRFTFTNRRHHCRFCGQIFCSKCLTIVEINNLQTKICTTCDESAPRKLLSKSQQEINDVTNTHSNLKKFITSSPRGSIPPPNESIDHTPTKSIRLQDESFVLSTELEEKLEQEEEWDWGFDLQTQDSESLLEIPETKSEDYKQIRDLLERTDKDIQNHSHLIESLEESKTILAEYPRMAKKSKISKLAFPLVAPSTLELNRTSQQKVLVTRAEEKIYALARQCLEDEELDLSWLDVVLTLSTRAVQAIKGTCTNQGLIDIREFSKVKIVPSGLKNECKFIDGVVFTKALGDRHMPTRFSQPQIMLFDCPLEYQPETKLLELDQVLIQEASYLKSIVKRIAALKPDIVLISKNVSRLVQQYFAEEKISFVQHVKLDVIHRIAQWTGSTIVRNPSTIEIEKPILGKVNSLTQRTYSGSWGMKTILIFEEFVPDQEQTKPKYRSCSLLLRGGSYDELRKIKEILLFIAWAGFSLQLEAHLLLDLASTISGVSPNAEGVVRKHKRDLSLSASPADHPPPRECSKAEARKELPTLEHSSTRSEGTTVARAAWETNESNEENASKRGESKASEVKSSQELVKTEAKPTERLNAVSLTIRLPFREIKFIPLPSLYISDDDEDEDEVIRQSALIGIRSTKPSSRHYTVPLFDHPFYHQKVMFLYSTCCHNTSKQCRPYQFVHTDFYSPNDMSLGSFLQSYCFQQRSSCLCGRLVGEHEKSFIHYNSRLNINTYKSTDLEINSLLKNTQKSKVWTWNYCKICQKSSPFVSLSEEAQSYSFGKFLEMYFYGTEYISATCSHSLTRNQTRYFYHNDAIVEVEHEQLQILDVVLPSLKLEPLPQHKQENKIDFEGAARIIFDYILNRLHEMEHLKIDTASTLQDKINRWQKAKSFFFNNMADHSTISPDTRAAYLYNYTASMYTYLFLAYSRFTKRFKNAKPIVMRHSMHLKPISYDSSRMSAIDIEGGARHLMKSSNSHYSLDNFETEKNSPEPETPSFRMSQDPIDPTAETSVVAESTRTSNDYERPFADDEGLMDMYSPQPNTFAAKKKKTQSKEVPRASQAPQNQTLNSQNKETNSQNKETNSQNKETNSQNKEANSQNKETNSQNKETLNSQNNETNSQNKETNSQSNDDSKKDTLSTDELHINDDSKKEVKFSVSPNEAPEAERTENLVRLRRNSASSRHNAISGAPSMHRRNPSLQLPDEHFSPFNLHSLPAEASQHLFGTVVWRYLDENNVWTRLDEREEKVLEVAWRQDWLSANLPKERTADFSKMVIVNNKGEKNPRKLERLDSRLPTVPRRDDLRPNTSSGQTATIPNEIAQFCEDPRAFFLPLLHGVSLLTPLADGVMLVPGAETRVTPINENQLSSFVLYLLCSEEFQKRSDMFDKEFRELVPRPTSWMDCRLKTDVIEKFELECGDVPIKFIISAYFTKQFHALRGLIGTEEDYIRSLSSSAPWEASGGKSKASWERTSDGRFLMKEVSDIELEAFRRFGNTYFEYMLTAVKQKVPTMLGKIVGIYRLTYNSPATTIKKTFAVMENLFYGHEITRVFDLKGSRRSRYVKEEGNQTLMDENLLERMFTSPIYVSQGQKIPLLSSVWNDSTYLSSLNVMDYSLLVGINEKNNKLVVGIIDYIRKYTWDKQIERWAKSIESVTRRGEVPTVISPKEYRTRFREAMELYFVAVPQGDVEYEI